MDIIFIIILILVNCLFVTGWFISTISTRRKINQIHQNSEEHKKIALETFLKIFKLMEEQNQYLTYLKDKISIVPYPQTFGLTTEKKGNRGNPNPRTEEQKRIASEKRKEWWAKQRMTEAQRAATPQETPSNS